MPSSPPPPLSSSTTSTDTLLDDHSPTSPAPAPVSPSEPPPDTLRWLDVEDPPLPPALPELTPELDPSLDLPPALDDPFYPDKPAEIPDSEPTSRVQGLGNEPGAEVDPAPPSPYPSAPSDCSFRSLSLEIQRLRADLDQATRAFSGLTRRLGLDYMPLSTRIVDVRASYRTRGVLIEELERGQTVMTPELAEHWGSELMRVTPSYLSLVREACHDPAPWLTFTRLVELGLLHAPSDLVNAHRWAYGLLSTGLRTVLHAGYLLSRDLGLPEQGLSDPSQDDRFDTQILSMVSYLRDRL